MTSKVYRSAQGKMVDLGTIMLQNEHVRAVGNMKVNARGDKLNSNNQVIETKNQQIQRQNDRTSTNVSSAPVHSSAKKRRKVEQSTPIAPAQDIAPITPPVEVPPPVQQLVQHIAPVNRVTTPPAPEVKNTAPTPKPIQSAKPVTAETLAGTKGGLAGAIARNREIKQELDRTRRQQAQDSGVKKI